MSLIKIQQELKAPKNQFNAFAKYKYRSAEDIIEAAKDYALAVAASAVTMGVSLLLDFAPEYAVLIGAITAPAIRWADKNSPQYGRE